ncbi:MAG: helix-turn-helix transcriptional regulator [Candidatus Kapaibacterium sp.]
MKRNTGRQTVTNEKFRDSRKRVLSLLKKADALLYSDLEKSAGLCLQSINESRASKQAELLAASLAIGGKCFLVRAELKKSEQYSRQAKKLYERMGDLDGMLDAELREISAKLFITNEKGLLTRLHEILAYRITTPPEISGPETRRSFYIPRSWEDRLLDKIPSPKEIENARQLHLAEVYGTLSLTYNDLKDKRSLTYLHNQLSISRKLKNDNLMAIALNNLGTAYIIFDNKTLAADYLLKALALYRKIGHKRGEAAAIKNLAKVYLQTGRITLGKRLSQKALYVFKELKMWEAVSRTLLTLAVHERLYGSLINAEKLIREALYYLKDREKSALYYYITYHANLIECSRHPSRKNYRKLVQLYETIKTHGAEAEEAAQEIARIAQELGLYSDSVRWLKIVHKHEIERIKNEQKNVITSLETQQELERVANEREVEKLRVDNLELELKAKNRETELLASQLAKKGSFLTLLVHELRSLRSSDPLNAIGKAIGLIESKQFRDSEFEQLEERVLSLHRDFLKVLFERCPALTEAEKRVCVLLKVGLKPADIASVLFASVRTVETHCLSIRKKLHLFRKIRLVPYLREL